MAKIQDSTNKDVPAASGRGMRKVPWRTLVFAIPAALGAGLVASLLAVVLMGVLRVLAGIPTPVELFGEFYLKHIDVSTFIHLLHVYRSNPKTGPLGLALVSMMAVGTAGGLLYALAARVRFPVQSRRPARREWLVALVFAVVMTLIGVILFWNELPTNFIGLPYKVALILAILGFLADFGLYGIVLALSYRALLPLRRSADVDPDQAIPRRRFLGGAIVGALAVAAGGGIYGLLQAYLSKYSSYDGFGPLAREVTPSITPNSEHYVVTKNAVDPQADVGLWRLEVNGLIKKTGSYTYEELQRLHTESRAITLECISNGLGETRLMSTAVWEGVPLNTVLEQLGGAQTSATYVAFYSADGYSISLPIDEVMKADALLAWHMNGEVLSQRHGYPLRVLMPGRYGEENPKWLTRIELTDHFVTGIYASQGWYNGPLHTTSRIDRPNVKRVLSAGQLVEAGGIAFAGNRGISKVELSVDGGQTWQVATLQTPASKDAWVQWSVAWTPGQAGKYTLKVRATDGTGELQTSHVQGTVPNGATGYHTVVVEVM